MKYIDCSLTARDPACRWLARTLCAALCIAATLDAPEALAKSTRVLDYRYETIWSTVIRLLRVERGYEIRDKDRDNGYVLFVYPGTGQVRRCPASLEIISFTDSEQLRRHRLQLNIEHQPSYVEVHLLDKIEEKLREEHGAPPPPERVEPPKDKNKPRAKPKDKDAPDDGERDKDEGDKDQRERDEGKNE